MNHTNKNDSLESPTEVPSKGVVQDDAYRALYHLAVLVEADTSTFPSWAKDDCKSVSNWTVNGTFQYLFGSVKDCKSVSNWTVSETFQYLFGAAEDSAWFSITDENITSPILKAALSSETSNWARDNADTLMVLFSQKMRQHDLSTLLGAGVCVSAKSVITLFSNFPRGRGDQFNNKIAKILCTKCTITLESDYEFGLVLQAASHSIGKKTRKDVIEALKRASEEKQKQKKMNTQDKKSPMETDGNPIDESEIQGQESNGTDKATENKVMQKQYDFDGYNKRVKSALQWYNGLYKQILEQASDKLRFDAQRTEENLAESTDLLHSPNATPVKKPKLVLSSDEVAEALSKCDTEDALASVETSIDLFQWDSMSEWNVDITENAHKWFRRHIKKDRALCERVIRRLTLLSTGRWPYVLCKRLKSRKPSCALYETKVDSASRIIWEVAVAFSARRSSADQNYCEQVIRVWDIVLDHDNLSRAIEQTVDRIEKSHLRGEQCALYSEIDTPSGASVNHAEGGKLRIPRVFAMKQEVSCLDSPKQPPTGKSHFFHPASSDPRQFTLLKFYELNAGAIKILLDGQDDNCDLPFTPGPKEHEIIHFQTKPQRSILLMGRSGTGKTTCLVFRMFAQHASYIDGTENRHPRQLFLTKNDVLCREVERSYNNMGLAWRRRCAGSNPTANTGTRPSMYRPKFLTSSEWLDILDVELPGDRFFTAYELEQRLENRKENDTVTKGIEAWLAEETTKEKQSSSCRQEMTFETFRKLWRKICSGSRTQLDSALVWREINSFIKGSVSALHIDGPERSLSQNRFLSLDEYLDIPRKQSRMDESQRREVYELYCRYEQLKKELCYFDQCDLVYHIAGRISLLGSGSLNSITDGLDLLPIDALYVDECQDFTQAELYVMTKLCRDPDSLFLAGDTAQSIALGVDFRFTDVRQIFFNLFGGIEPKLLQLTHNYRSHSGVLRLAAAVVELLYFFFSNSLDRLPPDLGLFTGPKPVIMEISSAADLVLMLEGNKRETSRIEFGAHQVVIVRSETAKKNLPDEFGVDKDWVMTVQESKGLEFDDVLLYNFFSDSPAEDLWRVVTNYTEEDIKAYYSDATVASSGVQTYDWESPLLRETRHLEFSIDQHKILETELKMLYTAITRARVNVFIAETNVERSRPMFNYFQRRCVVDLADKKGLSGVRVFGSMNTVQDWLKRGEYYLSNAEGDRQKGCLRLAAKCFDKAGDKRRDFAVALLSFVELEEKEGSKLRGKQSADYKLRLFSIGEQLLEARDLAFLNKAALCLLRTGQHDEQAAEMFELYARMCYTQRICDEKAKIILPYPPSPQEQKYFSYAGRLLAKLSQRQGAGDFALDSFRNFICAGLYAEASKLLSSGAIRHQDGQNFQKLFLLCREPAKLTDPISFFQKDFEESERCKMLVDALKFFVNIGCRTLHKSDKVGFSAALSLLPSRRDRIELLGNVDSSAENILSRKPWASNIIFGGKKQLSSEMSVDVTQLLVSELKAEERPSEAAAILEDRGFLLEAASMLVTNGDKSQSNRAFGLRVKYVELMMLSDEWKDNTERLLSILEANPVSKESGVSMNDSYSSLISQFLLQQRSSDLMMITPKFSESVMWQQRAFKLAASDKSEDVLMKCLPGSCISDRLNFVYSLAKKVKNLADVMRRPGSQSLEDNILLSHAESYFDLSPKKYDPSCLQTNPIVNARLREALHNEKMELPSASRAHSVLHGLDRDKAHSMLSKFVYSQAASTLLKLDDLIRASEKKIRPCLLHLQDRCKMGSKCIFQHSLSNNDIREYVKVLELYLHCMKDMTSLTSIGANSSILDPWINLKKRVQTGKDFATVHLHSILLHCNFVSFLSEASCKANVISSSSSIVLKQLTIDALKKYSAGKYHKLPSERKKIDIKDSINYWRILSLCESATYASEELHKDLVKLEKSPSSINDTKKKKWHYFINKKNQIFPRLWLWAVESVPDDIANTLSVIHRIIETSKREGLTPLPKNETISLMELNSAILFGALSLRYSEVAELPLLMSETTLRSFTEEGSGSAWIQGFGNPLKKPLLAYCSKHFDTVFASVVSHLEITAGAILKSKLLSPDPTGRDGKTFEKAFVMSSMICCNAIYFSSLGKDMDMHDYKSDMNTLPSLPLQGKIKELVAELRKIMWEKDLPLLFEKVFGRDERTLNFLEVANAINDLAQDVSGDCIVLCQFRQLSEQDVEVQYCEHPRSHGRLLEQVPFDESAENFGDRALKSNNFLTSLSTTSPVHDEAKQERKSEELNASRVITRLVRNRKEWKIKVSAALFHYRHWKRVLCNFSLLLKRKSEATSLESVKEEELTTENDTNNSNQCILDKLPRLLSTPNIFKQQKDSVMQTYNNAVVDSVECTFCCCLFDPIIATERNAIWESTGRMTPFPMHTGAFNFERFGHEKGNFHFFLEHQSYPVHQDNMSLYFRHLDNFTTVYARLLLSYELLDQFILACNSEGQKGHAMSPWYLNSAEEARQLLQTVQQSLDSTGTAGFNWSRNPTEGDIWNILQRVSVLPNNVEAFADKKILEEADARNISVENEDQGIADEKEIPANHIDELMRGGYLNPDS